MKTIIKVLIIIVMLLLSTNVFSYSGGITGRTLKTSTQGCNSCHIRSDTISAIITAPDTVIIGQTYTIYITIIMNTGSGGYGMDIATKYGILDTILGQQLKTSGLELVHSFPNTTTNTYSFKYTAPNFIGIDTIFSVIDRGSDYTSGSGFWNWIPSKKIIIKSLIGIQNIHNTIPHNYMSQNYPNPFNSTTLIKYQLNKNSNVSIKLYDICGKELMILLNDRKSVGQYNYELNMSNFSSGIYLYKIKTDNYTDIKKLVLVK